jgi:hypothetical protein
MDKRHRHTDRCKRTTDAVFEGLTRSERWCKQHHRNTKRHKLRDKPGEISILNQAPVRTREAESGMIQGETHGQANREQHTRSRHHRICCDTDSNQNSEHNSDAKNKQSPLRQRHKAAVIASKRGAGCHIHN